MPGRKQGTIFQVGMITKQNKSSKKEEHSTESDSSDLPVSQVKMTTPFDPKLEHLLTNYFSATGDQHDTRQTFIQKNILTFDLLIGMCTLRILRNTKLKKGNHCVNAFNEGKLKLVNNVLLYYNFLYQDDEDALAEDFTQWDKGDFRKLKSKGFPLSTDAYNVLQTGNSFSTNTNLQTSNATAPIAQNKLEDDTYLSWRRSKQDETSYPVLENDRLYTDLIVKTKCKFTSEEMYRMIDPNFHKNQINAGSDTLLFEAQENYMTSVLERVLQTSEGKRLTRKHPLDPQLVWKLHKAHATSSTTLSNICTGLSQELAKMKMHDFDLPTKSLDTFDSYLTQLNKISKGSPMHDLLSVMYLKSAFHGNKELVSTWMQCKSMKETVTPGTTPTYDKYYEYLLGYRTKLEVAVADNTPSPESQLS